MNYLLTNQNRFEHIPYPSPSHPNATVKSGGCGPCAALMIVENLTPSRYLMKDWIAWVISSGARVSGGTAMGTLAAAMAKKFGFDRKTTNSEAELTAHLKAGGMAIANVGGAYGDWRGLFSTAGHFIAILGSDGEGNLIAGDPDDREGKFSAGALGQWRSRYVEVEDGLVYVKPDVLHRDTQQRNPGYYLFSLKKEEKGGETGMAANRYHSLNEIPGWGRETAQKLVTRGWLKGNGNDDLYLSPDMLRLLVVLDRAGLFG